MATSKSTSGSGSKTPTKPPAKAAPAKPAPAKPAPAPAPAKPAPAKPAPAKPAAAKPAAKPSAKSAAVASPSVAEIIAASEAIAYALIVRASTGSTTYTDATDEIVVGPPTLFALAPVAPPTRRFLYLIQKEAASGHIVLVHVVDGAGATRVPAATGWQRAIVEGTLHLLASDLLLTRADLVALIGGHEPPPSSTKPPFS